jgi:hypothetical protein
MFNEFRQLSGNLLRSAPESIDRLENSSSSISSVRGSVNSGRTLISPQVLSDLQRNALPSSHKTAGTEPSTEKILIETSTDNIILRSEKFKVEETLQGTQTLIEGGGDPYGTRTRVFAVKGRCPRPLDEGVTAPLSYMAYAVKSIGIFIQFLLYLLIFLFDGCCAELLPNDSHL